ncbi:tetratricopeptide repeat protein [Planctomycetota bacterium]
MRKTVIYLIATLLAGIVSIFVLVIIAFYRGEPTLEEIIAIQKDDEKYKPLTILYPLDETLFPPEIVAPTFRWEQGASGEDAWLVNFTFQDGKDPTQAITHEPKWAPDPGQWEVIKKRSLEKDTEVMILGVTKGLKTKISSMGRITIRTSKDKVEAPIFYREVNLPFIEAVKDPSQIRWRFGAISSPRQPPIILENLPVCGNCHSFSSEGKILAMDVDYANSKGSYVITNIAEEMVLATSDIITWNDYKKEDKEQTFGLLSQVSPDGRFVVSTVKDKSVFVPMPPLAFSQLFFPVKGILCTYDRQTRTFQSLSGADDPHYVQSNPAWSPDGQYIVFARSKAYDLKHTKGKGQVLLTREECKEFTEDGKPFLFDLYRIPFNDGKGGPPEPIEGASDNGMSNFFAKYSPDGQWIVFCKAKSYMLLQPDSELYIIPAEGGEARRLRANTRQMNSWHSWSPNGKWLVFSSKAYSPYTQLFLTHIDEQGHSSPAVLLEHFTSSERAANIPEFINTKTTAIKKIREEFLNDYSFVRAGNEFFKAGDFIAAEQQCRKALELNPNNVEAHCTLAYALENKGMLNESVNHLLEAINIEPNRVDARYNLGQAMVRQGRLDEAIEHFSVTVKIKPDHIKAHGNLGSILLSKGAIKEATVHLFEAIRIDPDNAEAHYSIALVMVGQRRLDDALGHYTKAVELRPDIDISPVLHYGLAMNYGEARRFREAEQSARKALDLARVAGDKEFEREITKWLEIYKELNDSVKTNDKK